MAKKKLKKKTASKAKSAKRIDQMADPVLNSARDIVRAGLGALAVAQKEGGKIREQGSALFEKLVAEGAKLEKEGKQSAEESAASVRKGVSGMRDELESRLDAARKQAEDRWDKLESVFEERVARVMAGLGVPSSDDVSKLTSQVETLARQVAQLSGERPAAKAAAKKPAPARKKAKRKAKRTAKRASGKAARTAASKIASPRGEVVFHLVPKDKDWAITREGADGDLGVHGTKAEALEAARKAAQAAEPSRLVVHKADGTIQASYNYGDA